MAPFNSSTPAPSIIRISLNSSKLFPNILLRNIKEYFCTQICPSVNDISRFEDINILQGLKIYFSSWKASLAENYFTRLFWTWLQSILNLGHILLYKLKKNCVISFVKIVFIYLTLINIFFLLPNLGYFENMLFLIHNQTRE